MTCEVWNQRGQRDLFCVQRDLSGFCSRASESRQIGLEGGGPQTNRAGLDKQSPQRAKASGTDDMQMSTGLPNTHAAVTLGFLSEKKPASLDTRNPVGNTHV